MFLRSILSALAGFVCGVGTGCVLELTHDVACGDGYVDREAAEECDPEADRDEWDRCEAGFTASCDEVLCQVVCVGCGNGTREGNEECDAGIGGGPMPARACAASELGAPDPLPALTPGKDGVRYASGSSTRCEADCTYDRSACSYCGNDVIDPARELSLTTEATSLAEVCDGDDFDPNYLNELASELHAFVCAEGLRPIAVCNPGCTTASLVGAGCCLVTEQPCPEAGDEFACCHSYDHPELELHCTDVITQDGDDPDPNEGGARQCR